MLSVLGAKRQYDYLLMGAVLVLVSLGLVFVYSASWYSAYNDYGNSYYFVFKQSIGALVGLVAMVACMLCNIQWIKKLWIIGIAVSIVLLLLVFVPGIGIENYGATRWIGFGGFSIQPSEIAKFAYVLFCAVYMSSRDMSKLHNALLPIAVGLVLCVLIILEPNMSITMCMALIMLVMLFLSGVKIKHFLLACAPLLIAVPLLILLEPYRMQRLIAYLDPWASPKDEGYQLIQSLYALGSGGWFGLGLFNSRQKYEFLPFAESDFVFSIIGEEIGLVGCMFVLALYIVVIYRGIVIAINCTERYTAYLSAGIVAVIAVQSFINFAVVTGSMPPTGLPLPFISYGGTSLVVFMSATGLLLNCSKYG